MAKTAKDIMKFIKEEGIQMVDFKIVDINGQFRHVTIPASQFNEDTMKDGIGFDASNYGYAVVEKSDMVFIPDPDTAIIDPFCEIPTLSMTGNAMIIDSPENRPLAQYPRNIIKAAVEYMKKAIPEIQAAGGHFPVIILVQYNGGTEWGSRCTLLQQTMHNLFNTDELKALTGGNNVIDIQINNFGSQGFLSGTRSAGNYCLQECNWGADYADPVNYLGQEILSESANYKTYNNMLTLEKNDYNADLFTAYETFTQMVKDADAIVDDHDARLAAFAKAEAYMIENVLVLPCNYSVSWGLSRVNYYSRMNAIFGCQNDKMKNWETNVNGYTTEEMAAAAAASKKK